MPGTFGNPHVKSETFDVAAKGGVNKFAQWSPVAVAAVVGAVAGLRRFQLNDMCNRQRHRRVHMPEVARRESQLVGMHKSCEMEKQKMADRLNTVNRTSRYATGLATGACILSRRHNTLALNECIYYFIIQ